MDELNLLDEPQPSSSSSTPSLAGGGGGKPYSVSAPFNPDEVREAARGDLARGLLWLLTFAIGGVLAFVAMGRLEGTVITQSIFPSLVALAGTALGFYFGSSAKNVESGVTTIPAGSVVTAAANLKAPVANAGADQNVAAGATVSLNGSAVTSGQPAYAWTLTAVPAGSKATLTGANTASPTFLADLPGSYVAQLIVNDGLASAPSMTRVTAS